MNILFYSGPHQLSLGLSNSFQESLSSFSYFNVILSSFKALLLASYSFVQFFSMAL